MGFLLQTHADLNVHVLAEAMEGWSLDESLTWAWETFGTQAAIGTSYQGSGLVIIHHAMQLGLRFPVFTVDTGLLFPETLELKSRLEEFFGIQIESLTPAQTVAEQNESYGGELWKTSPDTCCTLRKVLPLQKKLSQLDVWITGVRRNQTDNRAKMKHLELYEFDKIREHYLLKLNPMLNWSREEVWDYIHQHRIPYNPLHDRGYRSIGCWTCTKPKGGENERAGRWEGFDKTECGIHTFLGQNI
ncbi:MAG: phosphoadenylyl-sulfate reductase [Verrucomicrobiales bacterium]|nr:phosphoadenylyl-sulfate reductase [Verrucomicrobiales bacterium]